MNHRLITILIGLCIIAAVVGGVVSWEWKHITPKQTEIANTSSLTEASTTPRSSTSSVVVFPMLVVGPYRVEAADGVASAFPTIIAVNEPTDVIVTIQITDTRLIAGSVNLQRLDEGGKVLVILGTLNDSGTNGDAVAGDRTYSIVGFIEATTTPIRLQVSWALRGVLRRATSNVLAVEVGRRFVDASGSLSFAVPADLSATTEDGTSFAFRPKGDENGAAEGPYISVQIKSNPGNKNLRDFYASPDERDLFSQSGQDVSTGVINGVPYTLFVPAATLIGERIFVIQGTSFMLEIDDASNSFDGRRGLGEDVVSTLRFR